MEARAGRAELKLLLDEMISGAVAARLVQRGRDVRAVVESDELRGAPDETVFEAAQRDGRVLVTYNRGDFMSLAASYAADDRPHNGLVILHPLRFPGDQIAPLATALDEFLSSGRVMVSAVHWLERAAY